MTRRTVRRTPAPMAGLKRLGGAILSAFIMGAVLLSGAAPAYAGAADANRAIGVAKALIAKNPETFGTKLRRLAATAATANPYTQAPYKTATAYAFGQTVKAGEVRSNAGNWYVAASSGTTGGSGASAAPTHTNGSAVVDGTGGVLWTYFGAAQSTADDAATPTVAVGTSIPGGFTMTYVINPSGSGSNYYLPGAVKLIGGIATNNAGSLKIATFNSNVSTTVAKRSAIEFETDEASVAFSLAPSSRPVQVTINGRRYAPDGILTGASGTQIIQLTFSGRAVRRIRVEYDGTSTNGFGNIFTLPTGQIWAPGDEYIRPIFITDSLDDGSSFGPFITGGSLGARVSSLLGWGDPWQFTTGGTGWNTSNTFYNYAQRIPEALTRNPDVWVFMGSTNDSTTGLSAAVTAALQLIRSGGSTAPIIVLGVWPTGTGALTQETAVKAGVTAFVDPLNKTFFIPISGDLVQPWVTGSWNNTNFPNSNTQSLMISGDGTHPPDLGTAYLARRIVQAIRAQVLPGII